MARESVTSPGDKQRAVDALERAVACAERGVADRPVVLMRREDLSNLDAPNVRGSLDRVLMGDYPDEGLDALLAGGVLGALLPEVGAMVGFGDGEWRHKDVWKHTKQVVGQSIPRLEVRWAALFHDIGKVRTRSISPSGEVHFFGHAEVGARMFEKLERRGCATNVCSEAAATAKRCEVEENKQAGELSKALQHCKPGDERCSTDALARCTAAVEKRGCDAAACDACPDDPGKTLPGVCGCGYSDAPNTNGVGCTFCALNAPGCEFGCLAPPPCLCGGNAECCTDNPCCDDCPAPHPPQCFVNTCSCAPDTCCFTSCP